MNRPSPGFTLIEVLVALLLISVVLLAVTPMFLHAARSNAASGDLTSCGALAMEQLEVLRLEKFNDLVVGGSLAADVTGYVDTSNRGFVVRWQVSDAAAPTGAKRIAVRAIARRRMVGQNKRATLTTLRVR